MLGGVGTVSRAITKMLCDLASVRAAFTAGPFGVMMIPWSPAAMALSMALICVVVSPSVDPAETLSCTLSLAASAFALFSMEMKYGLVKSLRISATWTALPPTALLALVLALALVLVLVLVLALVLLLLDELQAATASPAAAARTASWVNFDRGL